MKSQPKRIILFFAAACLLSSIKTCRADGSAGTTSADFLRLAGDARAEAMGEAYTAVVENANAVFLNPARLAYVDWHDLSVSNLSLFKGISYKQAAYAANFGKNGTLGMGLSWLSSGDIEGRDEYDRAVGHFGVEDVAAAFGYGNKIGGGVSAGVAVKFISERIKNHSGGGFSADLGAAYTGGYEKHVLTAAVTLQHLGPEAGAGEKSPLPTTLRAGIADRLSGGKIIFSGEIVYPFDLDLRINAGAEFLVADFLALRAGYRFLREEVKGIQALSFGFGLIYPQRRIYLLDYAGSLRGDLGAAHRVTIGVKF